MASLIETFLPFSTYNVLPHIKEAANVPSDHSEDLEDLRKLLTKHDVPKDVSIRLIHKHFDTREGEVMIFDKILIPGYGTVQTMKPVLPSKNHTLWGIHYYVNDACLLQAYEFTSFDVPDMSTFETFLEEFCQLVSERNLQHKFGLKLKVNDELDRLSWTEFEFNQKRSTIMLQDGMPMPNWDFDYTVSTEWNAFLVEDDTKTCKHKTTCRHGRTTCNHCRHYTSHDIEDMRRTGGDSGDESFCLGGQSVMPGTPIFEVVNAITVQAL